MSDNDINREEGWGVMRPGDRRHHYYVGSFSLCGRVGFYMDHLDPDTGNAGQLDCAGCGKKLRSRDAGRRPAAT